MFSALYNNINVLHVFFSTKGRHSDEVLSSITPIITIIMRNSTGMCMKFSRFIFDNQSDGKPCTYSTSTITVTLDTCMYMYMYKQVWYVVHAYVHALHVPGATCSCSSQASQRI